MCWRLDALHTWTISCFVCNNCRTSTMDLFLRACDLFYIPKKITRMLKVKILTLCFIFITSTLVGGEDISKLMKAFDLVDGYDEIKIEVSFKFNSIFNNVQLIEFMGDHGDCVETCATPSRVRRMMRIVRFLSNDQDKVMCRYHSFLFCCKCCMNMLTNVQH